MPGSASTSKSSGDTKGKEVLIVEDDKSKAVWHIFLTDEGESEKTMDWGSSMQNDVRNGFADTHTRDWEPSDHEPTTSGAYSD